MKLFCWKNTFRCCDSDWLLLTDAWIDRLSIFGLGCFGCSCIWWIVAWRWRYCCVAPDAVDAANLCGLHALFERALTENGRKQTNEYYLRTKYRVADVSESAFGRTYHWMGCCCYLRYYREHIFYSMWYQLMLVAPYLICVDQNGYHVVVLVVILVQIWQRMRHMVQLKFNLNLCQSSKIIIAGRYHRKHHSPQFPLLSSKSNSFFTESTDSIRSLFSTSLVFEFACSVFLLCEGNSFFLKPKEIAVPLVSTVEERFLLSVWPCDDAKKII